GTSSGGDERVSRAMRRSVRAFSAQ
nr:unnamed protein product [Chocolate lily virus A]